jgi:streptomycin 6-kinase
MTDDLHLDLAALTAIGVDEATIAERRRLDGDRALVFLSGLPELVAQWQDSLGLSEARLLPGGVLSAAFVCRSGGEEVVLKLSAPYATSARAEAAALAAWEGCGACRLRFATEDGRVLLLDAIRPGAEPQPRSEPDDARRAAELLHRLHLSPPFPVAVPEASAELRWRFQRARQLLDGPSPARGVISQQDIESAYHRALGLCAESPVAVLCHGDFLDKNILVDGEGRWWAIDPHPCRGDPCLDAAFWALAHRGGQGAAERGSVIAAATALDVARVQDWMRVFAVSESVLARDAERSVAYRAVLGERTSRSMR